MHLLSYGVVSTSWIRRASLKVGNAMAAYSAQPRATASEPFSERRINGVSMQLSARASTRDAINGTRAVPPYLLEGHNSAARMQGNDRVCVCVCMCVCVCVCDTQREKDTERQRHRERDTAAGLLQIAQLKRVQVDIGGSGTLQNLLDWSHHGIENTTRLQHLFQLFSGSVAPNLQSTNDDVCTSSHSTKRLERFGQISPTSSQSRSVD